VAFSSSGPALIATELCPEIANKVDALAKSEKSLVRLSGWNVRDANYALHIRHFAQQPYSYS
jgi:hypothetical protein